MSSIPKPSIEFSTATSVVKNTHSISNFHPPEQRQVIQSVSTYIHFLTIQINNLKHKTSPALNKHNVTSKKIAKGERMEALHHARALYRSCTIYNAYMYT